MRGRGGGGEGGEGRVRKGKGGMEGSKCPHHDDMGVHCQL